MGLALVFGFFYTSMNPGQIADLPFLGALYRFTGFPPIHKYLAILSVLVIFAFVVRAGVLLLAGWISVAFRRRIQDSLASRLFNSYMHQPLVWHMKRGSSYLLNAVVSGTGQVGQHIIVGSLDIATSLITLSFLLLTMAWLKPEETAFAAAFLFVLGGSFILFFRPILSRWGLRMMTASEHMWQAAREPLRGVKIVKVYGLEKYFADRFRSALNEFLDINVKNSLVQQLPKLILEASIITGILTVISIAFSTGVEASSIIPGMILFAGAAIRLLPQIVNIIGNINYMRFSEAALASVSEDMNLPSGEGADNDTHRHDAFNSLSLRNVGFFYDGQSRPALRDINLDLKAGEHLALVGLSGAGKTTLVDLLLGLIRHHSGALTMNGQPLDSFPRDLFTYVPQDPFIVHDTLAKNIALGADIIDHDALLRAVGDAALNEVIARLPNGLDSLMGEDGLGLSGGERQRLGIARALYRDAPIIIMDEPTSALDAVTEAQISGTIAALRGKKNIIMIAHRISLVKCFDKLAMMEDGHIADIGTFDQLYTNNNRFRAMVDILNMTTDVR